MSDNPNLIYAPWTTKQVNALNDWQRRNTVHPYTCAVDSQHRDLVATQIGWICEDCEYTQNWAFTMSTQCLETPRSAVSFHELIAINYPHLLEQFKPVDPQLKKVIEVLIKNRRDYKDPAAEFEKLLKEVETWQDKYLDLLMKMDSKKYENHVQNM